MNRFNVSPKVWTVFSVYAHTFIGAVTACYMLGNHTPKALVDAGIAAILPVILRWANPADKFPAPQVSLATATAVVNTPAAPVVATPATPAPTA